MQLQPADARVTVHWSHVTHVCRTPQNVVRAKLLGQRVLNLQQIPAIVRGYDDRHQTLNYRQLPLRRRRALLQKMEWAGAHAKDRAYECVGSQPL